MADKIQQSDIEAGRDFAGRDMTKTTNVFVQRGRLSAMQALIEMYRAEQASSAEYQEIVDDLQHYLLAPGGGVPFGLEEKLALAGRQAQFLEAARLKERFAMKLAKHQLSKAAQEIFALILGKAVMLFRAYIVPLIEAEFNDAVVQQALVERVIDPVMQELEENVLLLKYPDLEGMIYFLTGNCHLRWHVS